MVKKALRKAWDFGTTLVITVLFLVIAGSLASGTLGLPTWLGFVPAWIPVVVGWILVVSVLLNLVMSIWNLFTKK